MPHSKVFMDIKADDVYLGKLVFELNSTVCPRTSENFRLLCTGEKGFGYKDCVFYRVIPGFCACSGDFETQNADRKGGKSAIGSKYFDDENYTLLHDKRMNNFHVAFGKLVDGFDVLDEIEKLGILDGSFTLTKMLMNKGVTENRL